jgi:1,4-dihydroxy-2-naphthoate octaprenyltransferase
MSTPSQWIAGARPRTLPAAVVPVAVGTGVAIGYDGAVWWRALLALFVALALQVGVNYANDYSDGVRGTDDNRVGPMRLVGSGAASPRQVLAAALGCFLAAAVAGLVLVVVTGAWWLLLVGAASIAAAWFYTGGSTPYGYRALGEVSVFVFFGLVAVLGTSYVQIEELTAGAWWAGAGVGALACAILVANNLRDIPSDSAVGKRTLAVVLGDRAARLLYAALLAAAVAALVGVAALVTWWVLLGLTGAGLSLRALAVVWRGTTGSALVPVLRDTGLAELAYATGLLLGCVIARAT